jgi:hypothetical protein
VAVSQETSSQITSEAEFTHVIGVIEAKTVVPTDGFEKSVTQDMDSNEINLKEVLFDNGSADRIRVEAAMVTQYCHKYIPAMAREILFNAEAADRIMVKTAFVTHYCSKHLPVMGKEIFSDAEAIDRIRMETAMVTHYCSKHIPSMVNEILSDAEAADRIGSPLTPTSTSTGTAVKSLLEMKISKRFSLHKK